MCRKGKNNLFTWKWAFHSADSWKLFGFARLDYSLTIMSGMSSWGRNWLTEDSLCFCLHIPKKKKKIFNTISWTTQDFSKISSCSVFLPEIENDVIHIWLASGLLINVKISQAEVKKHTRTHTHTRTRTHTHTHTHTHLSSSLIQSSSRVLVHLCCFHVVLTEREGQETIQSSDTRYYEWWIINICVSVAVN